LVRLTPRAIAGVQQRRHSGVFSGAGGLLLFAVGVRDLSRRRRSICWMISLRQAANCTVRFRFFRILGTYNYQWVNENGHTATTEASFDATTGALKRLRALSSDTTTGKTIEQSPSENSNDMLLVSDRDSVGNIIQERYYGGDGAARAFATGGCTSTLPSLTGYDVRYGWTSGVLSLKRYYDNTNSVLMFNAIDWTIDASGAVTSERDSAGIQTSYAYDLGRLKTISPTGETSSSITYVNASGTTTRAAATITRGDMSGTTTFDGLGRVITETHSMPGSVTALRATTYDLAGRNSTQSEFDDATLTPSHTTTYTYDIFDRPLTVTAPDGKVVTNSYTGVQATVRSATVQGVSGTMTAATTETYDPLGRLTTVTEGSGAGGANVTTSYGYDVADHLKSVYTSDGTTAQSRTFTYDNRGLIQSETHPEMSATTYRNYDARGHATQIFTGVEGGPFDLLYTYDAAERLKKIEDLVPSTSTRRQLKAFTYATANSPASCTTPSTTCDARNGKLISAVRTNYDATIGNVDVTSSFFYQGLGGRASEIDVAASQTSGFTGRTFTVSQSYNGLGLPSSITYPTCVASCSASGTVGTLSLGYTTGLLTSVGTYASSLTYRTNGELATVVHGNGLTETWGADANKMPRPSSITATNSAGTLWSSGAYSYDGSGNIATIGTKSYAYDKVNRLVSFTDTGVTSGYTYDAFGNQIARTYRLRAGDHSTNMSVAIPVDPATNHLKAWRSGGAAASTYDAAGNQLRWTTTDPDDYKSRWSTGVWDAVGSMHSLTTSNGSTTFYIYDADDERLATVVRNASTSQSTIRWTLRGFDSELLRTYTDTNGSFAWTEDNIFRGAQLLANEASTGTKHYALDHLGSPRVVTNGSGSLIGYEDFAPFGDGGGTGSGTLQFTGHERDWNPAGGSDPLDYMHSRYYSANAGRFVSVDSGPYLLNQPQGWNRYAYAANDPMRRTDPTGRCGESADFVGPQAPCDWGIAESIEVEGDVPWTGNFFGGIFSTFNLMNWMGGGLPRVSAADPRSAAELSGTPTMEQIRKKYSDADCRDGRYWGDYQYSELTSTTTMTGQLVGAFGADIRTMSNGEIVVKAFNTWGLESGTRFPGTSNRHNASIEQMLMNGAPLQYPKSFLENRNGGAFGTATLNYIWTEGSPCAQ
jgi:RHS repeat-associated protein